MVKDARNTNISIIPYGRSFDVDIDIYAHESFDYQVYTDEEYEELRNVVKDWYDNIAKTLKEGGYSYIEEMESEEYIRECIIALEDYYTKDGRVI